MEMPKSPRTVLITGSGRGIGAAAAKKFWEAGDRVVLNALHPENIGAMAEKMNALRPGSALAVKADVSDSREAERLFDEAEAAFGPVDVLINNAAVSLIKLFQDITDDEWRHVFGAGIDSAFYCSRRAAKGMIRRQGGVILNVSSMWGQTGGSCEVAYSAAKGAVIAFTKALAKELGPSGIRVNCVSPGVILTDMNKELGEETLRELAEEAPLCRNGKPEEVADMLYFLASENAAFVTGQVIGVNGGMVI